MYTTSYCLSLPSDCYHSLPLSRAWVREGERRVYVGSKLCSILAWTCSICPLWRQVALSTFSSSPRQKWPCPIDHASGCTWVLNTGDVLLWRGGWRWGNCAASETHTWQTVGAGENLHPVRSPLPGLQSKSQWNTLQAKMDLGRKGKQILCLCL